MRAHKRCVCRLPVAPNGLHVVVRLSDTRRVDFCILDAYILILCRVPSGRLSLSHRRWYCRAGVSPLSRYFGCSCSSVADSAADATRAYYAEPVLPATAFWAASAAADVTDPPPPPPPPPPLLPLPAGLTFLTSAAAPPAALGRSTSVVAPGLLKI